jgi:hypothetical protein
MKHLKSVTVAKANTWNEFWNDFADNWNEFWGKD